MAFNTSSGTTALTTASDTAIDAVAAPTGNKWIKQFILFNTGAVPGFYSIDGTTWHYLQANGFVLDDDIHSNSAIQIKRIPGGDNVTGIYTSSQQS